MALEGREQITFLRKLKKENPFYKKLYSSIDLSRTNEFEKLMNSLPFITKEMIANDQLVNSPYGSNHSSKMESFIRYHQTSGTTGEPIRWLDTKESWAWVVKNWEQVLKNSNIKKNDIAFFAFSFGPFLGFWGAFESATKFGVLSIPGGGMSSESRIETILKNNVNVLCCTPTYAIYLGKMKKKLRYKSKVAKIIVAGEPGGNLPMVRKKIKELWDGAEIYDHHGMTEVGPMSYQVDFEGKKSLEIIPREFFCEVKLQNTDEIAKEGFGELIVSTFGRFDCPLIRYQTGDLVDLVKRKKGKVVYDVLKGGIIGRIDQMKIIRGVNIYPSAVEEVLQSVKGLHEYRLVFQRAFELDEVIVEIECDSAKGKGVSETVEKLFKKHFQIRAQVKILKDGSLPRFELKANRWVDERK